MHIHEWPEGERPREKLMARGAGSLSDAELLAIFLGSGTVGHDAVSSARGLLAEHGGLRPLMDRSPQAMVSDLRGVGPARACALLKALGNPDRLLLLCQLTQGEFCVSELESMLGIQQPTLSQQLGVLREEQLVNTRREGKQIYYSLASKEAMAVLDVLYQQFCTKQ